jgi:eukaryotic-like serine/threonine-protein kinase
MEPPQEGHETLEELTGLILGRTLGEGGMSIVHDARQLGLDRQVAVKRLHSADNVAHVQRLLAEACATGLVDHPNVVPVYDLGKDENGEPYVVLKRIDGVTWTEVIDDAERAEKLFGDTDLLGFNLNILMEVCHAIEFAHEKRILHRDLKPDNVMIGQFGEVYVLDWGIAVRLDDRAFSPIPLASAQRSMAGTPHYMAPEMMGTGELSVRTDIYLLGAILFRILEGAPPHAGRDIGEVIERIRTVNPQASSDVPSELADLCNACLSRDPADRPASARRFREALLDFLSHRGSRQLARQASSRLSELEDLTRSNATDEQANARLFAECRFGFRQALQTWPANERAQRGLARALELMARHELELGRPRAAQAVLKEHADTPDELLALVQSAIDREALEVTATNQQKGPIASVGMRWAMLLLVGVGATSSVLIQADRLSVRSLLTSAFLFYAPILLAFVVLWSDVKRTPESRTLFGLTLLVMLAESALIAVALPLSLSLTAFRTALEMMTAMGLGAAGVVVDKRFHAAAAALAIAAIMRANVPSLDAAADILATSGFVVGVVWWAYIPRQYR